jgi:hypothetical protein
MWWIAFQNGDRIPLLTYVNFGIHEVGHFVSFFAPEVATALMGSIAQVGVPFALAVCFFVFRSDWVAAALCLAWAATSALEVAVYVADAPTQELELIGGMHDWAFILGPAGFDALDRAAEIAASIRSGAHVAIFTALALCVAAGFRSRSHSDPTASANPFTPASSH